MTQLDLYYKPTCPFCVKVMQVIEQVNLEITMHDISEDHKDRETLLKVGGKGQVPCLFIDGKPMYESSHIIDYLKTSEAQ